MNDRTMHTKRTQSILWAAGEAALSKAIQPRYLIMQVETVLAFRNPTQRDRNGEIPEGLPGSESVARRKRDARNLGGPMVSHVRVGGTNERRTSDGPWGVRSLHSTLRR